MTYEKMKLLLLFIWAFNLLVDFYIYFSLKNSNLFQRKPFLPKLYFTILVAVSLLNIYGMSSKISDGTPTVLVWWITMIVNLWYLPKIVILPFRIFIDIKKLIKIKFSSKKLETTQIALEQGKVNTKRRDLLTGAAYSAAVIPFATVAYGSLRGVFDHEIRFQTIRLDNLSSALSGLRIVQISDLHFGAFPDAQFFKETRWKIETLRPDILLITGDFVNFDPRELMPFAGEFSKLKAEHGVFACLGNHDHYMHGNMHSQLVNSIKSSGIDLLINENRQLNINRETLNLCGVDNIGLRQSFGNFDKALSGIKLGSPTILMCHDPSNWDKSIVDMPQVDLTLAGHTHGGQFGIELYGEMYSPVKMIYKQWSGYYENGNSKLYVNNGLGTTGPALRIGIRPEISVFDLVPNNNLA